MTSAEDTIRAAREHLRVVDGDDGPGDGDGEKKGRGPSHGAMMRQLLDDHFALVRSTDGRMFGVCHTEPGRAVQHDPKSSPLIRAVSRMFLDSTGQWPSTTGVAECSAYTLAMFDTAPTQQVPLRCHWDRDGMVLYLDTCDADGTVLRVDAEGVQPVAPPVAFRRAAVPAPIPWDAEVGYRDDVDVLWDVVRVTEEDRPIVLALLITAWFTNTPQPIVLITGPEDSGKTSAGRYLLSYVDPVSTQRGRSLPADEREWKAAVAYSRAVLVDNLSGLNAEASDLLCRVATGGEAASRALYTDDGSHVTNLHVPVWLTAIDPGALRGDLASRMVKVQLLPLDEDTRVAESDLAARQDAIRARVTRGLLWLTSNVLAEWAEVPKDKLGHRMGDFAIVVRCIDRLLGTEGEKRLAMDSRDLAADVVDASPLALAVVALMEPDMNGAVRMPPRRVTPGELLELLDCARADDGEWRMQHHDKGWPRTPKVLSAALTRIEPALRKSHGILVERSKSNGTRYIEITRSAA